jgi:phosphoribosyl-AMP cyclohydrolase
VTPDLSAIHFDAQGLISSVAQDIATGDVLLLAFMNADALERTLATGEAHFWSRSRNALWRKGESSGHTLRVEEVRVNCEGNSLLLRVRLTGPGVCHEGYHSCYYRRLESNGSLNIIAERVFDPTEVYGTDWSHPLTSGIARGSGADGEGESSGEHEPALIGSPHLEFPLSAAAERESGGEALPDLEAALRELYAGYVRLRDEDFTAVSQTSRLLHDPTATPEQFVARAQEELAELEGVVAGTHRHAGTRDDLLLEASQVLYWLCLAAARAGLAYDDWHPHAVLSRADQDLAPTGSSSPFAKMRRGSAGRSGTGPSGGPRGGAMLAQVARLLAQAGVAPIEPVQRDLASLRKRLANS